jgi:hypothetical protein
MLRYNWGLFLGFVEKNRREEPTAEAGEVMEIA